MLTGTLAGEKIPEREFISQNYNTSKYNGRLPGDALIKPIDAGRLWQYMQTVIYNDRRTLQLHCKARLLIILS